MPSKNLEYSINYGGLNNNNNNLLIRPTLNNKKLQTSLTHQQFTKQILPAPYTKLSPSASNENIVNSIFTQSQV